MIQLTRRSSLSVLALALASPALSRKRPKTAPLPDPGPGPFNDIANKLLGQLKEMGCYNGVPLALDGGPLARSIDDYSPAGEQTLRSDLKASRDLLARIRLKMDDRTASYLNVISATLENGTRSAGVPYGRVNPINYTGHTPYLVNQISGPHIDGPNIMMEQQSLSTVNAVDAWIAKLDSFPSGFAGIIEKIRSDQAAGCLPPRTLIDKALPIIGDFLAGEPSTHPMMKALARRTDEAGLSKRIKSTALRRAMTSLQKRARPAFDALRTQMVQLQSVGRDDAGIWAQPQGDELYAANVRALGDTSLSPEEIHKVGLDEVARIASIMNGLLAKQGMPDGPIGERMLALAKDPKNLFADSDAGRDQLLDYVRSKVRDAEALYSELLPPDLIPRQALIVKRVPLATQDTAAGGYYDGPSLDGTRPGTYWINLRDMAAVPRFRLPTLSYHEGVPGHHTQGSIAAAMGDAPLLARIASFNAYQEGWALYAEQLMSERGAYENDPLGNLGRLQDELFRAVRLVIDTGLHHKRWSRVQSIRTMRDITGVAESRVVAEVERYMAWPGQALGYKLGQLRLLDLRKSFLAKKGRTIKEFHGLVLGSGAMPLAEIESRLG